MLTPALVIGLIVGMALGRKYRVFVLAPVFGLAFTLAGAMAIAHPDTLWLISKTMVMTIFGVQVGYIAAILLRHLTLVIRASRRRSHQLRGSAPSRRPAY